MAGTTANPMSHEVIVMTQATDSSASATLSGRELALKRRKAMALHGKSGTAKAASVSKPSARRVKPAPAAIVRRSPVCYSDKILRRPEGSPLWWGAGRTGTYPSNTCERAAARHGPLPRQFDGRGGLVHRLDVSEVTLWSTET